MRCFNLRLASLAAIILSAAVPLHVRAQARDVKLNPDQIYTNAPSKFQFPPTIATFQRNPTFVQYDPDGRDIGIGYTETPSGAAATIFVYPVSQDPPNNKLDSHFESCKTEVLARHAGSKLLSDAKIQIAPGGKKQDGLHAAFDSTEMFAGKVQPIKLELYLFTHNKEFVLYRITYPAAQQAAAEPAIKAFLEGLAWP
jgi:hypothetical protein